VRKLPHHRSRAAHRDRQWPAELSGICPRAATTKQSLDQFLSSEHTRMPDFSLGRYERNALSDYILSLR
jgi:hypothetical protein